MFESRSDSSDSGKSTALLHNYNSASNSVRVVLLRAMISGDIRRTAAQTGARQNEGAQNRQRQQGARIYRE